MTKDNILIGCSVILGLGVAAFLIAKDVKPNSKNQDLSVMQSPVLPRIQKTIDNINSNPKTKAGNLKAVATSEGTGFRIISLDDQ